MTILKIKDKKTNEWVSIQTIRGEKGEQGPAGKNGNDYVLTEKDKKEIANIVLLELPSSEDVSY